MSSEKLDNLKGDNVDFEYNYRCYDLARTALRYFVKLF